MDRGPPRLLEQFKNKAVLTALLNSYLARVQELEDATWEVIFARNLKDGQGVVLDWIGTIVGRDRQGLGDDDYRIALRAQIRINRTQGKPEDVIDVASLSLPDQTNFTYTEQYPCGIYLEVLDQVVFSVSVLFRLLVKAKAGGVRLFLIYSIDPPATVFQFADHDPLGYVTPVYDLAHGCGWENDPTMGGTLVMIQGS